eukprot:TRINITY_DN13319_c0_g1_i1.p1 TRINITY_DN13319_c0_g1~~TRINITY_DN13319_c0_g1_i1.p1  ORF type:complete len:265 (-),score=58.54 TRINITY_DN13319_c0_g1_i1:64-858(-)
MSPDHWKQAVQEHRMYMYDLFVKARVLVLMWRTTHVKTVAYLETMCRVRERLSFLDQQCGTVNNNDGTKNRAQVNSLGVLTLFNHCPQLLQEKHAHSFENLALTLRESMSTWESVSDKMFQVSEQGRRYYDEQILPDLPTEVICRSNHETIERVVSSSSSPSDDRCQISYTSGQQADKVISAADACYSTASLSTMHEWLAQLPRYYVKETELKRALLTHLSDADALTPERLTDITTQWSIQTHIPEAKILEQISIVTNLLLPTV